MLDFGITLKLDWTPEQAIALTRRAEANGFTYGWVFDSHVLWMEAYTMLGVMAVNTERMHLGTCVTNPGVRDLTVTASTYATLNRISGGRMEMGIGRGDSSRRVLGRKPMTLAHLEEAVQTIRALAEGQEVELDGVPTRLTWAEGKLPIWVAAYGPKALELTGRVADGVVLQYADPHLIRWCLGIVRKGAEAAGRDPSQIKVMSAAPTFVSEDLARARENCRWFGAMVGNHVADLVERYSADELPPELTAYIRGRKGYDYHHHAVIGSDNAQFVTDEIVDRFCVLGTPEQCRAKLGELQAAGVTQYNIYLMNGDEEHTLDVYGRDIIPEFRGEQTLEIGD